MKQKNQNIILILMLSGFSYLKLYALEMDLRYEYEKFNTHNYRILYREENLLLLLKDSITEAEPDLPVIGCSAPFFTFGSFTKGGLLKAMDNTSCYSADSSFFTEKTTFKTDTSMTVNRRAVFAVNPLPGIWSLYGIKTPDELMRIGSFFTVSLWKWLLLEAAADFTLPAENTEQALMHFAGKLGYTDKALCLSLSSVLSAAAAAIPGHSTRLAVLYTGKHIRPGFALWCNSPDYLNPQGRSSSVLFQGEGVLELLPFAGMNIRTLYGIRINSPGKLPGIYLPSCEYFLLETGYSRKLQPDIAITVESRLEKEQKYTKEGAIGSKLALSCCSTVNAGNVNSSLCLEAEKEPDKIPVCTIIPGFSCKAPGLKLDLGFRWQCSNPVSWGCSLKAAFYHKGYTLGLKLATAEMICIEQVDEAKAPAAWADLLNFKITWSCSIK